MISRVLFRLAVAAVVATAGALPAAVAAAPPAVTAGDNPGPLLARP